MNVVQAFRNRYQVAADPLRTERRIELIVLLLAVLLCLQLVYGTARLLIATTPIPVTPAEGALAVHKVVRPVEVDTQQSNEIRERPVFWASRRAVEGAAPAATTKSKRGKSKKMPPVKLVGVFGGGESLGIIVLVEGKRRRVSLNEKLDGWVLNSVTSSEAVFIAGGQRERLALHSRVITTPVSLKPAGQSARKQTTDSTPGNAEPAPNKEGSTRPASKKAEDSLSLGGS